MISINDEKKGEIQRALFKIERDALVAGIRVTTSNGRQFDGDELSQSRIARAIAGLQAQPDTLTVRWVLSDNSVADVDVIELQEALSLAILRQAELWAPA